MQGLVATATASSGKVMREITSLRMLIGCHIHLKPAVSHCFPDCQEAKEIIYRLRAAVWFDHLDYILCWVF